MADRPKRPLSAYMIWLNEHREQIKKENPGVKVTEIAKRGGELWRGLKDKSEWDRKAVEAKENYVRLIKDFEANGGSKDGGGGGGGGGKKRGKVVKKAAPAKKSKKPAESDDDDSAEDESE